MPIKDYDFIGSYNNQRVTSIDAERSINCFEYIDPLGKKPKTLINTSGLVGTDSDFGAASLGFRAQFTFNNHEYDVIGNSVFRRDTSGTVMFLGNLVNTNTGYVGVDANTFQVIFVDGRNGYIWDDIAMTFEMITDSSFPIKPLDTCYLDGFFVVVNGDTNGFQLSSFNQGMVWGVGENLFTADTVTQFITVGASTLDGGSSGTPNYATGTTVTLTTTGALPAPLVAGTQYWVIRLDSTHIQLATSYADAIAGNNIVLTTNGSGTNTIISDGQLQQGFITSHPGTIVACRTLHRRLFLFSQFFTEVWENAGAGTNLPFRRNNSLLMEYGTPSAWSIAVSFDLMFFLAQDRGGLGSVMMVSGSQSIPVSNRALDFQLAQYAALQQVSDCAGFLIKENGLIFYRMNFTAANHTYIYDVTLSNPLTEDGKLWHEEEVLNGDRHPAQTHAYFNGINYVGDYAGPLLYRVDSQEFTNDGEAIRRVRIGRPIVPEGYQRIRIDRLQLDLLQGQLIESTATVDEENLLTETGIEILTESGVEIAVSPANPVPDFGPPYVFLSLSRDGGQTYGYVLKSPMGRVGNRAFRTVWRKLGTIPRGQAFVPKIEFYTATPFVLMGAAWVFEILPE